MLIFHGLLQYMLLNSDLNTNLFVVIISRKERKNVHLSFSLFFFIFPDPEGLVLCGSFGGRCNGEINTAVRLIHGDHNVPPLQARDVDRAARARRREVLKRGGGGL